jgi:hypothetical protein
VRTKCARDGHDKGYQFSREHASLLLIRASRVAIFGRPKYARTSSG